MVLRHKSFLLCTIPNYSSLPYNISSLTMTTQDTPVLAPSPSVFRHLVGRSASPPYAHSHPQTQPSHRLHTAVVVVDESHAAVSYFVQDVMNPERDTVLLLCVSEAEVKMKTPNDEYLAATRAFAL